MSTTSAPALPTAHSITNGSHTPPPAQSPSAPSPSTSVAPAVNPSTPRSASVHNAGFGQNAVAGPSRSPSTVPTPSSGAAASTPSFPPGAFAGLNGSLPNGSSTLQPGISVNGTPAQGAGSGAGAAPGPGDAAAALQARIRLAQQAMQANMLQHQQQQQQQQALQNGRGSPPRLSGTESSANGGSDAEDAGARRISAGAGLPEQRLQDSKTMANAMGMLQSIPGNPASKEAMMKQLQALTNTRAQRERLQSATPSRPNVPLAASPSNSTSQPPASTPQPQNQTSPASQPPPPTASIAPPIAAPSPAAPSPSNAPAHTQSRPPPDQYGTPARMPNGIPLPNEAALKAAGITLTPEQKEYILAQQRMRAMAMYQAGLIPGGGGPTRPAPNAPGGQGMDGQAHTPQASDPATPQNAPTPSAAQASTPGPSGTPQQQQQQARVPHASEQQRKQFIQSFVSYYKQTGQTPPPEILSGRPGSIQMGDHTIELVDLFLMIMRQAGGQAGQLSNGQPHPVFNQYIHLYRIPNPLPAPVGVPKPENWNPAMPGETNDPIRFLFLVYLKYLQGFEMHMTRSRNAMEQQRQRQVAANAAAAGGTAGGGAGTPGASGPQYQAPTPTAPAPGTPAASVSAPSPASTTQPKGRPKKAPAAAVVAVGKDPRPIPAPVRVDLAQVMGEKPAVGSPIAITPNTMTASKKRKKGKGDTSGGTSGESSRPQTPAATLPPYPTATAMPLSVAISEPVRPPTPKRARYKVEYRPLQHPTHNLCGWDERSISSTFPKYNLHQPSRSIHELGIIDMEAILMGLRSRVPRELGYGLTVLNMLSMPHPEENLVGLPLTHLHEIYAEILDLLEELALGEDGLSRWKADHEGRGPPGADKQAVLEDGRDRNRLGFLELEQLGRAPDWSVPSEPDPPVRPTGHTGGNTDLILSILNLLRNFSMAPDNHAVMAAHPEIIHLLAAVSDASLCRLPPDDKGTEPYSILELGRVRRDCVTILCSIAPYIDLRTTDPWAVLSTFRLLASFLNSAWSALGQKESWLAPYAPIQDTPLPIIHSVNRAMEAWSRLAHADSNREILSRLPSDELLELFSNLVRLLPVTPRQLEALRVFHEESMAATECLGMALYSLVFLAPQSVRAQMRKFPGTAGILLRIIDHTSLVPPHPPGPHGRPQPPPPHVDYRSNPLSIYSRRISETLAVLNGTTSCAGDAVVGSISFSASLSLGSGTLSGGGAGWSFANKQVESGWLAGREETLRGIQGRVGVDPGIKQDLDGMWWAGGEA